MSEINLERFSLVTPLESPLEVGPGGLQLKKIPCKVSERGNPSERANRQNDGSYSVALDPASQDQDNLNGVGTQYLLYIFQNPEACPDSYIAENKNDRVEVVTNKAGHHILKVNHVFLSHTILTYPLRPQYTSEDFVFDLGETKPTEQQIQTFINKVWGRLSNDPTSNQNILNSAVIFAFGNARPGRSSVL